MSGKVLQATIIELAHMYGWRVAHFTSVLATGRDGQPRYRTPVSADGKGFPDLVLVRSHDRVMFVEVKGDGDKVRPEQQQWLDDLRSCAIHDVYVWTPKELDDGSIAEALQVDRPPPPPPPPIIVKPATEFRGW
jgi:hypothetical protein